MVMRLLVLALILLVGAVVWDWSGPIAGSPSRDEACADRSTAWAMAKVIVRENLSSSLSTKFPHRTAANGLEGMGSRYLGDCRHSISAFVDTYDRESGLIRRYFAVELSYRGRSGWRLDRLEFTTPPNSEARSFSPTTSHAVEGDLTRPKRPETMTGLWNPNWRLEENQGGLTGPEKPETKTGLWNPNWRLEENIR